MMKRERPAVKARTIATAKDGIFHAFEVETRSALKPFYKLHAVVYEQLALSNSYST
jgi:hypothetical protein